MHIDDAYRVERVLANGMGGETELVTVEGAGPFVRKKIPEEFARRRVWSVLPECASARLPKIEATYELPDRFVVVYDYVPGDSLRKLLSDKGCLSEALAVRLACEICEAVQALHAHGVVHRDITPANIIVAEDGAHLVDLGIARMRTEGVSRDTMSLGTWGFASPEQYGFAQTDARSDVYSIGRVLGCMLTGIQPGDEGYDEVLSDASVVSDSLRAVIEKACAFEPSARYQSAASLVDALRDALSAAEPAHASSSEKARDALACSSAPSDSSSASIGAFSGKKIRWGKKRRKMIAAIVLAVVVLAVCVVVGIAQGWWPGVIAESQRDASARGLSGVAADAFGGMSSVGTHDGPAESQGGELPSKSNSSAADSSDSSGLSPDVDLPNVLEVVESGWSVDSHGYVSAAFAVRNNASNVMVRCPAVQVVGYAQDGSILFCDEQVLSCIPPGQTFYFGNAFGNGIAPYKVEFSSVEPKGYHLIDAPDVPELVVSDVSQTKDSLGGIVFTGEIARKDDAAFDTEDGQAVVSVVLRDKTGAIVYGSCSFADLSPAAPRAVFEIDVFDKVDFESYEIYAHAW